MACIDLTGRAVLVVGAGRVALEKIEGLLAAGAEVTVVAPQVLPEVEALGADDRPPRLPHGGPRREVPRRRRHCDDVGEPARLPRCRSRAPCSATSSTCPSSARSSSPPSTATSRSPSRSRPAAPRPRSPSICATRSPPSFGPSMPSWRDRLRELRPWAKSHFATYEERKAYFAGPRRRGAGRMTVHLVGAGPGDPGLITARGLELVRACDVLVADALVAQELIDEAPDDAIVISRAGMKQEAVTRLLVAYGTTGLDIVRLKGGDPFVFGRGGEEALALAEAGIPLRDRPRCLVDRGRPCLGTDPRHPPRRLRPRHDRERARRRRRRARLRVARRGRRHARAVHGARAGRAALPRPRRCRAAGRRRRPPSSRAARCPTRNPSRERSRPWPSSRPASSRRRS